MSERAQVGVARAATFVAPLVIGAAVLAACGGSDGAAAPSKSTVSLDTTAFATIPPATTSTVPDEAEPGGVSKVEQEYTIEKGDYPLGVADRFGVTVEELAKYNDISNCTSQLCTTFPGIGSTIKIPPNAIVPESEATSADTGGGDDGVRSVTGGEEETADGSDDSGESADDEGSGDTIPEAGDNCQAGSYTIKDEDKSRIKVAEKFDVTVEALDAANASTSGYSAFYPGLQIVIPARDDC